MRLLAETLWFKPAPGPLLPQLRAQLEELCQQRGGAATRALRWALTAAEQARGVRIEVVLVLEEPTLPQASAPRPEEAHRALPCTTTAASATPGCPPVISSQDSPCSAIAEAFPLTSEALPLTSSVIASSASSLTASQARPASAHAALALPPGW
ncbi:MAG: hypothetical protein ACO3B3_06110 [Cyanobium sp.]